MRRNEELATWLASQVESEKSRALRVDLAERHKNLPVLVAAREALDREEVTTPEQVLEVIRPLIEDDSWALGMLQDYFEAQAKDRFFIPPVPHLQSDVFTGLQLFDHPKVRLALGSFEIHQLANKKLAAKGEGAIGLSGFLSYYKFIKSGNAHLSLWTGPQSSDVTTFDESLTITRSGALDLKDGATFLMDGRKDSFVIERANRSLVILQAVIMAERSPLLVDFSATTKRYLSCGAAEVSSSRLQMLATMLRIMGRDDAIEALKPFLSHNDFFVRWHVMREALAMNATEVRGELAQMARHDRREELRGLAARTLRQLDQLSAATPEAA